MRQSDRILCVCAHVHIQSSYNDMKARECCIFDKVECQGKDSKEFMKSLLQSLLPRISQFTRGNPQLDA
jgi:hypothetical protein